MKILDVGSGGSALPFYLQSKGGDVTLFDLEEPLEKPHYALLSQYKRMQYRYGSVLNLPFRNNSFELVLCLSTIEHLDYDFTRKKPLSYDLFLKHTKKALSEIVRVLKPKGRLFLTSEVYLPRLQKGDRYSHEFLYKGIGAGYKAEDFQNIFLTELGKLGCKLIDDSDFNFSKLIADSSRSNYRGRYFTTFALYAEKT